MRVGLLLLALCNVAAAAPAADAAATRALAQHGCKGPRWHALGGGGWLADCVSLQGRDREERHRLFVVRGPSLQLLTQYENDFHARVPWHYSFHVDGDRVTTAASAEFGARRQSTWDTRALPARLVELRAGGEQPCKKSVMTGLGGPIAKGANDVRLPLCTVDFDKQEQRCTRYTAACDSPGSFAGKELRAIPVHDNKARLRTSAVDCGVRFGEAAREIEVLAVERGGHEPLQLELRGKTGGQWELWIATTTGQGDCGESFDETCRALRRALLEHYLVAPPRVTAAPGSRATLAPELDAAGDATRTTVTLRGAAARAARAGGLTVGHRGSAGLTTTTPVADDDVGTLGLLGDAELCDAPDASSLFAPSGPVERIE